MKAFCRFFLFLLLLLLHVISRFFLWRSTADGQEIAAALRQAEEDNKTQIKPHVKADGPASVFILGKKHGKVTFDSAKDFIGYKDLSYDDSSSDETYIYKDVLEQYQDMVQNDFYKNLIDSDNYDSSFGEAIGLEIRHLVQDIYYALYDIDGNGRAELIIAGGENRNANADNSPWNYDLYGYDGFTPEKIDSFAVAGHLEGDEPVFDYLQNGDEITEDEYSANIQSYKIALAKGLHWIQIQ